MRFLSSRTVAAAALVLATAVQGGFARAQTAPVAAWASDATKRFVALAITGANFIDDAGRTAIANGAGPLLQRFAHDSVTEQDAAQKRLMKWSFVLQAAPAGPVIYDRPFDYGPIGLGFLPLNAAVIVGTSILNTTLGVTTAGVVVTSDHRQQLERMQALSGHDFERAYVDSQRKAYQTLLETYQDYARRGDDPAVRAVAAREVPTIKRQVGAVE